MRRLVLLMLLCSPVWAENRLVVYRQGHSALSVSVTNIDSALFVREGFKPDGMAFIPAKDSTFWFGDPNITGESLCTPARRVTLTQDFWIDTVEVMQSDYVAVMENTYARFTSPPWTEEHGKGATYPAYYLNWYDAVLYCNARSKRDGLDTVYLYDSVTGIPGRGGVLINVQIDRTWPGYHLPSEAQWEYACESGSDSSCYWGCKPFAQDTATANHFGWFAWNSGERLHPVALKLPNGYGLYDMNGNLQEWCEDWFIDPRPGFRLIIDSVIDPIGGANGTDKVLKSSEYGTGWAQDVWACYRQWDSPSSGWDVYGFRAALQAEREE